MKFIKVSGFVLLLHGVLAALLIFQSGCQNMQQTPEVSTCPYVIESEAVVSVPPSCPVPVSPMSNTTCVVKSCNVGNTVIKDNFMESSCAVVSQPVRTERFKPMRPTYDFSNDGLLTSIDDLQPSKPVSAVEGVMSIPQETYTVKSGDSLWVIAKRYNISTQELANINGISRDAMLKVGQKLVVPVSNNANISMNSVPSVEGGSYTIAKGDTLSEIALRFKVSVDAIKKANNMTNNNILAGKKIIIPGMNAQQIAAVAPIARSIEASKPISREGGYQVQTGDSLSVIAHRFGVTVADLMTWNQMSDAKKLRAGQTLIVSNPNSQMPVEMVPFTNNNGVASSSPDMNYNAIPVDTVPEVEEEISFDFFADDDLFGTADEIPLGTVDEE